MKTLVTLRLLPLVVLAGVVIATAMGAAATTSTSHTNVVPYCKSGQQSTKAKPCKAVPYCKTGQKSTKAKPCKTVPKCKAGETNTKAHPCLKPSTSTGSSSTGGSSSSSGGSSAAGGSSSSGGSSAGSGSQQIQADGCPVGQNIPQGTYAGDGDEDNEGLPDDGDGCS